MKKKIVIKSKGDVAHGIRDALVKELKPEFTKGGIELSGRSFVSKPSIGRPGMLITIEAPPEVTQLIITITGAVVSYYIIKLINKLAELLSKNPEQGNEEGITVIHNYEGGRVYFNLLADRNKCIEHFKKQDAIQKGGINENL